MSWEQEISEQLQEVQNVAVRFDISQVLTGEQKSTALNNIDIKTTATNISGNDYQITFLY